MNERTILVGIDVGGTFTHAVAVQQPGNQIIAHAVTPTTHSSKDSVSEGIITVFHDVLEQAHASSGEIQFVAHSTTQATNALLEGDVAKVGIIGMGKGLESLRAKADTQVKNLELSQGKFLATKHVYINTGSGEFSDQTIRNTLTEMKKDGCEVIVATEAFSVDDSQNEDKVVDLAVEDGFPATASHEISQLYGLKVRTRTAVINASILPKMTSTALLTDKSVKESGIKAPLMIVRSDGGVMDLDQMKRRPILTMLSGPAAGIAAALMYAKISDGIFLEVGGTSTDISAIKNGKAMSKSASVGGHLTYLKTLDSRTVGIGGGSMVRIKGSEVHEVGPRSAHIANLGYIAFSDPKELKQVQPLLVQPMENDPSDYLVAVNPNGKQFAITLTDASIVMEMTKPGDYAYNQQDTVLDVFTQIASVYGKTAREFATAILDEAIAKIRPVVDDLLAEYELDPTLVSLVGGGGGATAVVPWLGNRMGMKYLIAPKAEVISAIGAALAMLRDCVEWSVINPSEQDIVGIRKEAVGRLDAMGADPATIEVQIEVDQSKNILRAIATGAFRMDKDAHEIVDITEDEKLQKAAEAFKCDTSQVQKAAQTSRLSVYGHMMIEKQLFGLLKKNVQQYRVLDNNGVVKLQSNRGAVRQCTAKDMDAIYGFIERESEYNDVGMVLPEVFILHGNRIADFSTILNYGQLKSLVDIELEGLPKNEPVVVFINRRK
jgi:N-methylhydantoinase A/oxoprolinase/acetone carboxylase beta subunit